MTSELREKAELAVRKYRDEIEMHDGLTNYKTAVHFATEMLREREDKEKAIELLSQVLIGEHIPSRYREIEAFLRAARAITDPKENQQ